MVWVGSEVPSSHWFVAAVHHPPRSPKSGDAARRVALRWYGPPWVSLFGASKTKWSRKFKSLDDWPDI